MNIVQHYNTFNKQKIRGRRRALVLFDAGFSATPYTLFNDDESPIQQARDLANKMAKELGVSVHFVLLDGKNMHGNTGYMVFRKYI